MSEKIADDYGFTKLAAYLSANAYTGGDNGTFALATDADMDAVLTTDETGDWSNNLSLKKSIGHYDVPAWPSRGICNYVHVPGNSNIFEYMIHTNDTNIGQNGAVSQPSGTCFVPYYLNAINKQIFDDEGYADPVPGCVARIKALYDANQARLDAHFAKYKETRDYNTAFTMEDVIYADKVNGFLGTSTSTESSWTYETLYYIDKYRVANSNLSGAIYNETKVKEKAESIKSETESTYNNLTKITYLYPELKNMRFFMLLFGTIEKYTSYLAGGES